MPLPFALPVAWLLGVSLAWMARAELSRSDAPLVIGRSFLITSLFAGLVFLPVVAYFAAFHGDWAYLYFVAWSRVPSAMDLAFVLVAALQVPLAFAVAAPWAASKRGGLALQVTGGLAVIVLVAGVLCARRLGSSASFTQFHAGFGAIPIGKAPLGRGLLLGWSTLLVAWVFVARTLRERRKAR